MTYSLEEKVKWFAVFTRLTVVLLQWVFNITVPDHDADVFMKPLNISNTAATEFVDVFWNGLTRWDAQYFLHIAEYGYTYENTLAFFPLFPLLVRHISTLVIFIANMALSICGLEYPLSQHHTLLRVAICLNNFLFVKSSMVLFKLTCVVLKSDSLAYISAVLFCVNPASIFFSAAYSESLYCYLVFYGMLQLELRSSFINNIIIGIAALVRSNGLVNIGFILFQYLKLKAQNNLSFLFSVICTFGLVLTVLPFILYQMYGFGKYCIPHEEVTPQFIIEHAESNGFVMPGSHPDWCDSSIPFPYSHIQKKYWNVGFLRYYKWKQVPNFMLAVPVIIIVGKGAWGFVQQHKTKVLFLGLVDAAPGNSLPLRTLPYVLHCVALTVFCVLMINVQVTTRMLCSSTPVIYWFCALHLSRALSETTESKVLKKLNKQHNEMYFEPRINRKSKWRTFINTRVFTGYPLFIQLYFLSYLVIGTALFANYLPWT